MFQDKEDFFSAEIMDQARIALDEANMVLMVVDGREQLDDKDRRVARLLKKSKSTKPAVLVVNKVDNERMLGELRETMQKTYENLGLGEPVYVSAIHVCEFFFLNHFCFIL